MDHNWRAIWRFERMLNVPTKEALADEVACTRGMHHITQVPEDIV